MALTINQGFQKLSQNLEITPLQSVTVSGRQTAVREVVEKEITVLDSFIAGSYQRSTMISPLSEADVDIFCILSAKYYRQDGHAALLDLVKSALSKTYQTSAISRNGQAVTIRFTDFRVDVVPCFYREGGGYLIPDSSEKRWISTDPLKHIELWSAENKRKNGDFVPLIKMLKGWNKEHSETLRSFHLECLIYQSLQNITITNYPSGVRYVLDKARSLIGSVVADPAGYSGNLGSYLDTQSKKDEVLKRLNTALTRALEAEAYERNGQTELAFDRWRLVFGDYFPAYR